MPSIQFPPPVDPREVLLDWNHEQHPYKHYYVEAEIVITRDGEDYRWHLPHGPTGLQPTERAARSRAKRVIKYANSPPHYGDTIRAARSWGNKEICDILRLNPRNKFGNMCLGILVQTTRWALWELKRRSPKHWAKVMLESTGEEE